MARGDWRGGGDRDTDGRPGSDTSSASYDRIYDRRGESEISQRPETSIQILQNSLYEREAAANDIRQQAQSRVHVFQGVGKFIVPPGGYKDTWAAHAEMIKDPSQNLSFNPEKFLYFDKIIADRLKMPALSDPNHKDYAKYEGLRTNLAVMRNDILGFYVEDGSFDPEDIQHVPKIVGIAETIADALKNDKWYRRPFAPSLSIDVANVEAVGAREIYKFLLKHQTRPAGIFEDLRSRFKELLSMSNLTWGLPPIENTPFSDEGLAAAPPPQKECFTAEELAAACAKDNNRMVDLSIASANIADSVRSLDTLKAPARQTSAEEARKLFRFLRNLQHGDEPVEVWMQSGTPTEEVAKMEALHRLIEIYAGELHKATRARKESFYNIVVDDASEAAGGFALGMAVHTANSLLPGNPDLTTLDARIDAMPDIWDHRSQQSVKRLLDTLEAGLRHTMNADVGDKSAADRLVEFSENIRNHAQTLRRAQDMDAPAREESIELAREILRKLKGISFQDRPIEELTRGGTTAQNAEFAQKIDEMAEVYHNLLAEAAQQNPNILKDARVLEANEAVGQFAHAFSTMAAKEVHTDPAASQKISAEIAAMPNAWKNLDNQTVGKLAERMEAGVEQAAQAAQEQRIQQKRDQEIAEADVDEQAPGKRRRRRRSATSGISGGAMRKVDRDLKADDKTIAQAAVRAARSPGITAPRVEQPPVALRPEDIAAVQNVSSNIRNSTSESMGSSAVDVKPGDKIAPDDKGAAAFVDQMRDRRSRNAQGNRQGGSGNNRNNPNNNRPQRS